jgi:hypothetical protein
MLLGSSGPTLVNKIVYAKEADILIPTDRGMSAKRVVGGEISMSFVWTE